MKNGYESYSNFVQIVIDTDKCIACFQCELLCPANAITVQEKAVVDHKICRRCGHCYDICCSEAISLKKNN
ncbi:4Fe-4S dicluster domain-containing protein [Desulfonispora thiosulfatigenes DSM 11270]|uniref:4Fe-4S dicluster domain-containing protein n=1 Tax=Desulfonispora thiosulfatigenes DSM 11270 TaxID=656914 RepID=A0A1W1UQZ5_DESTI|nr:4Fe-4S binding protein [Desulfonispora thiosulfatigenes]SMB83517.1 4Fe-4S dicluster domain-containing protein [Desulfonispora thiosulfatigenes DSM 11270]